MKNLFLFLSSIFILASCKDGQTYITRIKDPINEAKYKILVPIEFMIRGSDILYDGRKVKKVQSKNGCYVYYTNEYSIRYNENQTPVLLFKDVRTLSNYPYNQELYFSDYAKIYEKIGTEYVVIKESKYNNFYKQFYKKDKYIALSHNKVAMNLGETRRINAVLVNGSDEEKWQGFEYKIENTDVARIKILDSKENSRDIVIEGVKPGQTYLNVKNKFSAFSKKVFISVSAKDIH